MLSYSLENCGIIIQTNHHIITRYYFRVSGAENQPPTVTSPSLRWAGHNITLRGRGQNLHWSPNQILSTFEKEGNLDRT